MSLKSVSQSVIKGDASTTKSPGGDRMGYQSQTPQLGAYILPTASPYLTRRGFQLTLQVTDKFCESACPVSRDASTRPASLSPA